MLQEEVCFRGLLQLSEVICVRETGFRPTSTLLPLHQRPQAISSKGIEPSKHKSVESCSCDPQMENTAPRGLNNKSNILSPEPCRDKTSVEGENSLRYRAGLADKPIGNFKHTKSASGGKQQPFEAQNGRS